MQPQPFKDFVIIPCRGSRLCKFFDFVQKRVVFCFDPYRGQGRKQLLDYLLDWVEFNWRGDQDDKARIRHYPYPSTHQEVVKAAAMAKKRDHQRTSPLKKNGSTEGNMRVRQPARTVAAPDGTQVVIQHALKKTSGNKRRQRLFSRPVAVAKSFLREVAIPEESTQDGEELGLADKALQVEGIGKPDLQDTENAPWPGAQDTAKVAGNTGGV